MRILQKLDRLARTDWLAHRSSPSRVHGCDKFSVADCFDSTHHQQKMKHSIQQQLQSTVCLPFPLWATALSQKVLNRQIMISSRTLSFILWSKALPLALHAAIIRGSMAFKPTSLQTYKTKTACFHSPTTCDRHDLSMKQDTLSYIEFYSGIGGWTMALEEAVCRLSKEDVIRNQPSRIAALDHSDLCTKVFEHNFGADRKAFRIERLTLEQMEAWNANIWFMSPPCQPHTRQHSNQEKDLDDPRSTSFLHLCRMLSQLNNLPSLILCENVIGFESSSSFQRWRSVLADRGYHVGHFHLSPTQVLLPNDRPRYYCVAVHNDHLKDDTLQSYLQSAESTKTSPTISVAIPELGVTEADCDRGDGASNMPLLSSFLDCAVDSSLRVPGKVLDTKASWCFDIVTPKDFRSRFVPLIISLALTRAVTHLNVLLI